MTKPNSKGMPTPFMAASSNCDPHKNKVRKQGWRSSALELCSSQCISCLGQAHSKLRPGQDEKVVPRRSDRSHEQVKDKPQTILGLSLYRCRLEVNLARASVPEVLILSHSLGVSAGSMEQEVLQPQLNVGERRLQHLRSSAMLYALFHLSIPWLECMANSQVSEFELQQPLQAIGNQAMAYLAKWMRTLEFFFLGLAQLSLSILLVHSYAPCMANKNSTNLFKAMHTSQSTPLHKKCYNSQTQGNFSMPIFLQHVDMIRNPMHTLNSVQSRPLALWNFRPRSQKTPKRFEK